MKIALKLLLGVFFINASGSLFASEVSDGAKVQEPLRLTIDPISSPQQVGVPFEITVRANREDYSDAIGIYSPSGKINPFYFKMKNGVATQAITLYDEALNYRFYVNGDSMGREDNSPHSNDFRVLDKEGKLLPNASVKGCVYLDNVNPKYIENALVELFLQDIQDPSQKTVIATAITDSTGTYQINNLLPGNYLLWVSHKNYDNIYCPREIFLGANLTTCEGSWRLNEKCCQCEVEDYEKYRDADEEKEPYFFGLTTEGKVQFTVTYGGAIPEEMEFYGTAEVYESALMFPKDGKYTVTLKAPQNEFYDIELIYLDYGSGAQLGYRGQGYYDDSLTSFSFEIHKEEGEKALRLPRQMGAPDDLHGENVGGKFSLSWTDPVGERRNDVDHYEVFTCECNSPIWTYYQQTKENFLLTDHDWKDPDDNNQYLVRSVLKNGKSTFFSQQVFYFDEQDQDDDDDDDFDLDEWIDGNYIDYPDEGESISSPSSC